MARLQGLTFTTEEQVPKEPSSMLADYDPSQFVPAKDNPANRAPVERLQEMAQKISLFSQARTKIFLNMAEYFPSTLTSMESSSSEYDLESSENRKPLGASMDAGTYTCTYHGCTLRFDTPAKLQRHKREGHMNSTTRHEKINPLNGKPYYSVFEKPYNSTPPENVTYYTQKQKVHYQQRNLKVLINGRKYTALGDAGASLNVISDRRRQELGLDIRSNPITLPMDNSKKIFSPGTVKMALALEDDPENILTIILYVVYNSTYDLILGKSFLQATEYFTKHIKEGSQGFTIQQRGLKVLINDRKYSAFGDTGAGQNVISDRRRQELGLDIRPNPTTFPMGNSKKIFSPGTVEVPIAFEDDPTNVISIVAHVVYTFAYDLLLGNPFLRATRCLTKHINRFVPCLFSLKSLWSFNLIGETTERFRGELGKGISFLGLPDIGSTRNMMDAGWAMAQSQNDGFKILTGQENCGWVLFPDGTEEASVGQAHTSITLPDGMVVPMVFELLPNCHIPVVLGQEFIFDHDIYMKYGSSLVNVEGMEFGDELMPMAFRRNRTKSKLKPGLNLPEDAQENELERQMEWNFKYKHGRIAPLEEWESEQARREDYERRQNSTWRPDSSISLIERKPLTGELNLPDRRSGARPSARSTQTLSANSIGGGRSDRMESFGSNGPAHTNSSLSGSPSSTSHSGTTSGAQDTYMEVWGGDDYFDHSLVSGEIAQWQAERPA